MSPVLVEGPSQYGPQAHSDSAATRLFWLSLFVVVGVAGLTPSGVTAQTSDGPMGWGDEQPSGSVVGDPERGKAVAEACAACHGPDGNSTDPRNPKLAGQNAQYLYSQLSAFKAGTRKSDIMAGFAKALSDSDMANVASFYNQQTVQPDTITDAGLAAAGKQIFYAGAGQGMAPACAMCHGAEGERGMPMMGDMPTMDGMMGMMANAPSLNGQHAAYIVDQLNRFASGERQAMMMGNIAAALSEMNKKAVAEYLSGLR